MEHAQGNSQDAIVYSYFTLEYLESFSKNIISFFPEH